MGQNIMALIVGDAVDQIATDAKFGERLAETIISTLKAPPEMPPVSGKTMSVQRNVTAYADCVLRSGFTTSGASFSAKQYKFSGKDPAGEKRLIVFLEPGEDGRYRLVADFAYESVSEQNRISKLIVGSR